MDTLGCNFAQRVNDGTDPRRALVILSFGSPRLVGGNWGASLFSSPDADTGPIRQGIQAFAEGYTLCLNIARYTDPSTWTYLAVGVTNLFPSGWPNSDANSHADQWKRMVNNANGWLQDNGYSGKVTVVGAGDIELGYSGPGRSRARVNGYANGPGSWRMYNFGDAAGCQDFDSGGPESCGTASYPAWDSSDAHYVSWGASPAFPTPQVYLNSGTHAEQWVMVSRWEIINGYTVMGFDGPVSQKKACDQVGCSASLDNTPTQAWNQMVNKMDARQSAIWNMEYSTDMRWQNP